MDVGPRSWELIGWISKKNSRCDFTAWSSKNHGLMHLKCGVFEQNQPRAAQGNENNEMEKTLVLRAWTPMPQIFYTAVSI